MSKPNVTPFPRRFTRHFSFHNLGYQSVAGEQSGVTATAAAMESIPTEKYLFLLLPKFSSITLAAAISTLSQANMLTGCELYEWQLATLDGQQLSASDGLMIGAQQALSDIDLASYTHLVVCGGDLHSAEDRKLILWLQKALNHSLQIGALGYGSYLLAAAGLLDGYRCTTHWDYLTSIREHYPKLRVLQQLFVIDGDRFTCSGGNSVMDMMLNMISQTHSPDLASAIAEVLVCDRMREGHETQRPPISSLLGNSQPRISDAIDIMEANIEEPLSLSELAGYVGVSARQLERLFKKYLGCMPSRYYMELRLTKAHQLLHQSHMSVTEIANVCGFTTTSHFSKCFREFFGLSPAKARN